MSHILRLHKVICKLALATPLVYLLTNPNLHIGSANETHVLLLYDGVSISFNMICPKASFCSVRKDKQRKALTNGQRESI